MNLFGLLFFKEINPSGAVWFNDVLPCMQAIACQCGIEPSVEFYESQATG